MLPEIANELIVAMGRRAHESGEVSVKQIPDVVGRLQLAFKASYPHGPLVGCAQPAMNGSCPGRDRRSKSAPPPVELFELSQLLELLGRAQRTQHPVHWG